MAYLSASFHEKRAPIWKSVEHELTHLQVRRRTTSACQAMLLEIGREVVILGVAVIVVAHVEGLVVCGDLTHRQRHP